MGDIYVNFLKKKNGFEDNIFVKFDLIDLFIVFL